MDSNANSIGSTRPYLLRALYEWCTDNGLTPYIAVRVDAGVRVPMEFVRNGEIVLNISFDATSGLHIDNDAVRFKARFGGIARDIFVPIGQVTAIYARENGQGMAFPVEAAEPGGDAASTADTPESTTEPVAAPRLRPVQSPASPADPAAHPQPDPDPASPTPKPGGARLTRVK